MDKKKAIFFILTMIVIIITAIFIVFICQYIGIPNIIITLILFIVGFLIGFTGRALYEKYK